MPWTEVWCWLTEGLGHSPEYYFAGQWFTDVQLKQAVPQILLASLSHLMR